MIKGIVTFFSLVLFLFTSCSLDYSTHTEDESNAPEFIFEQVTMMKIEEGKKDSTLTAQKMEQYRNADAVYGKNVAFKVFNTQGKISIEGKCGLLSADNDNELYILSDEVIVTSYEQNLQIASKSLRWNNQTEQLTNSRNEIITITNGLQNNDSNYAEPEKETNTSLTLTGKGLSASGVSRTYSLLEQIEGSIITEDSE